MSAGGVTPSLSAGLTAALAAAPSGAAHDLRATPETCFWGYFDRAQPPVLEIRSGDVVRVEAVTHHAGDAPDLLMDDAIRVLWAGIPEADRGPGVHVMTGPIAVEGAEPGHTLLVRVLEVTPRLPFGSNCAAHWGLLYDAFGKERITIYGLDDEGGETVATPAVRLRLHGAGPLRRPGRDHPAGPVGPPAASAGRCGCRSARTSA